MRSNELRNGLPSAADLDAVAEEEKVKAETAAPVCPRCKREIHPWPLVRSVKCLPPNWAYCIRNDETETAKARVTRDPFDELLAKAFALTRARASARTDPGEEMAYFAGLDPDVSE